MPLTNKLIWDFMPNRDGQWSDNAQIQPPEGGPCAGAARHAAPQIRCVAAPPADAARHDAPLTGDAKHATL